MDQALSVVGKFVTSAGPYRLIPAGSAGIQCQGWQNRKSGKKFIEKQLMGRKRSL